MQSLVDLSREQLDDVLYVRQLYLTKRGLLAEARNALVAEIHAVSGSTMTAGDSATKLSSLTCNLQQNAMQDYLIYIKVCAAVRRGVSLLLHVYVHIMPESMHRSLYNSTSQQQSSPAIHHTMTPNKWQLCA